MQTENDAEITENITETILKPKKLLLAVYSNSSFVILLIMINFSAYSWFSIANFILASSSSANSGLSLINPFTESLP